MDNTIKTHEPFEVEIFDAFNKMITCKDVSIKQTDDQSPTINIAATIGGKSLKMRIHLNVGNDAFEILQFSLSISCSCRITLDGVQVIYASDTSRQLATYMGMTLSKLKQVGDKPAKEKAYKAFAELIK